jgi:hypothetical protein
MLFSCIFSRFCGDGLNGKGLFFIVEARRREKKCAKNSGSKIGLNKLKGPKFHLPFFLKVYFAQISANVVGSVVAITLLK